MNKLNDFLLEFERQSLKSHLVLSFISRRGRREYPESNWGMLAFGMEERGLRASIVSMVVCASTSSLALSISYDALYSPELTLVMAFSGGINAKLRSASQEAGRFLVSSSVGRISSFPVTMPTVRKRCASYDCREPLEACATVAHPETEEREASIICPCPSASHFGILATSYNTVHRSIRYTV